MRCGSQIARRGSAAHKMRHRCRDNAVSLDLGGDGTAVIRMQPNSFAVVEW
jgi:hypothetical protein